MRRATITLLTLPIVAGYGIVMIYKWAGLLQHWSKNIIYLLIPLIITLNIISNWSHFFERTEYPLWTGLGTVSIPFSITKNALNEGNLILDKSEFLGQESWTSDNFYSAYVLLNQKYGYVSNASSKIIVFNLNNELFLQDVFIKKPWIFLTINKEFASIVNSKFQNTLIYSVSENNVSYFLVYYKPGSVFSYN